jgi:hypothetical protein
LEPRGGPRDTPKQSTEDEHNVGMFYCDFVCIFHLTQKECQSSVCSNVRKIGALGSLGGNIGSQYHQLLYVHLNINGRIVQDLADSRASHNLLKIEEAKETGLRFYWHSKFLV